MRRVIRRRIRHTQDGLDVAIDFNADVAVNVGRARAVTEAPPADDAPRDEHPDRPRDSDQERDAEP